MKEALVLCLALSIVIGPFSTAFPAQSESSSALVTTSASIVRVDPTTRMVTLRDPGGKTFSVKASDEIGSLSRFAAGDPVTVRYFESMAAQVNRTGGQSTANQSAGGGQATSGGRAGGTPVGQVRMSGTVERVDAGASEVTLKGADGRTETVKVMSPEDLAGLKAGDQLSVVYTEATAISLTKAKA